MTMLGKRPTGTGQSGTSHKCPPPPASLPIGESPPERTGSASALWPLCAAPPIVPGLQQGSAELARRVATRFGVMHGVEQLLRYDCGGRAAASLWCA